MSFVNKLVLTLTIAAALYSVAQAQTPANTTQDNSPVLTSDNVVRANTRLVVVDVVATDGKGQSVRDLSADNFTVKENGHVQKISNFQYHGGEARRSASLQLPPDIVTNLPAFHSSVLNVMVFDTLNGDFTEMAYVKEQLVKYLSRLQLDQPAALYALGERLVMLHDFTTDAVSLKTAAEQFKFPARFNNAETTASRASAFTTHGDFHTNDRTIEMTLNNLNALAKSLSNYPGRKNLIWLSESFPINLFPDMTNYGSAPLCNGEACGSGNADIGRAGLEGTGQGAYKDYAALIKKVSDSMTNAQVAVYFVDSGTLGKDSRLESHHTSDEMAYATGGKAYHNTNNLADSIQSSIEDGSSYYTIEYYPGNKKWDGQFRTIDIKVNRPGITLRHRHGYYALNPEEINHDKTSQVAENYSRAMQLDAPSATAILFQAQVLSPPGKKVNVTFHIDPATLGFAHTQDDHETGKFSCNVWAFGKDRDKPVRMTSDTIDARLNASEFQQMMKQRVVPCGGQLDLKAGSYTLRLGVLDRTTNKIGTATAVVTVP